MRYEQLIKFAEKEKPHTLVEIGTHKGARAAALKQHCKQYFGFDLWESGNEETDKRERNGKGRSSMEQARYALNGADFELIQGDTRQTLPEFVRRGIKVDFVFLDGGHSIETIRSDFDCVLQMLNPGATVVFDDYYEPEVPGFGCNKIVEAIPHQKCAGDVFDGTLIRLVKYKHKSS